MIRPHRDFTYEIWSRFKECWSLVLHLPNLWLLSCCCWQFWLSATKKPLKFGLIWVDEWQQITRWDVYQSIRLIKANKPQRRQGFPNWPFAVLRCCWDRRNDQVRCQLSARMEVIYICNHWSMLRLKLTSSSRGERFLSRAWVLREQRIYVYFRVEKYTPWLWLSGKKVWPFSFSPKWAGIVSLFLITSRQKGPCGNPAVNPKVTFLIWWIPWGS